MSQQTAEGVSAGNINNTIKGIIILISSTLFFAGQDAITKSLVENLPVMQIIFFRFFFFAIFAIIFAARRIGIRNAFRSHTPGLQILRGVLIVSEISLFAWCLHFMGLAEVHAIFASFPLVITMLVPILGEQVGWRRWLAVGCGFIGTLIIIQPTGDEFNYYTVIVMICVFMFAVYNLLTRKVSQHDHFETSLIYFGVVGCIMASLAIPFFWQPLNTRVC